MPIWRRNLFVLWFGTFMAGLAFSEVMPFLSLYVDTLGDFTRDQLNLYSGITFSATYLVTAIASPIWGRLADRKGRKLMLIRASLGMAVVMALMGAVTDVWQLMALRFIQGIFSGYISNANALMATQVPKDKSGQALGTLATGFVGGSLFGPMLGGTLAQLFSYRVTFFITGALLLSVFILSYYFVKETFEPVTKENMLSGKEVIGAIRHPKLIIGMFVTTLIIQASNTSISPILALYVREIMPRGAAVTFFAGIVAAIPGVATLFAAPRLGRLGDRIGTERVLSIGFIFAILVYIPMAFVTNVWQLMFLRFLIGISNATMLPAVQTILSKNTPPQVTGRIFSYNQSFQAIGSVLGPMLGSLVSTTFDYRGVFISTAILVLINFLMVWHNTSQLRQKHSK
ncbi:multidrug efflux MFS transporter [uncultured Secundilactobacillus sp.]|uniref:multidrug efflux MFS transporter n=1 Tax=uncultured Secundilactobacillus sp. TaxID=2813935 RepID=UPI00258ABD97|nr:multidrug efflux MFS transporter [uncultured Secundilactobacillus sp.]